MEIKTKFNLNDTVYPIIKTGYNGFKTCETCKGHKFVKINDTERKISCPDCYGRGGSEEWITEQWIIDNKSIGKIGKIEVELYLKKYSKNGYCMDRNLYMLDSTGVGSGTNWYEKDLFSTAEEAELECKIRNK